VTETGATLPLSDLGTTPSTAITAARLHAVERAIVAMRQRLDEPLSLDTMASVAIFSRYHFSRVFHELTGLPPSRFLAALRLAEAKRLLLTTRLSVTDICFRVGYNSLGTFTMRFTQSVGISPTRFRQLPFTGPASVPKALNLANQGEPHTGGVIAGRVEAPASLAGPVFIGLFTSSVPEGRPCHCTALASSGEYRMEGVAHGSYYVFAISFPWPREPLAMLLPEPSSLHVGRSGAVGVRGQDTERADLQLRPAALTDPPVLIALPVLLADHIERVATSV
jgi:AraC family transcriptional regulator